IIAMRLLLIEDDLSIAQIVKKELEKSGYAVDAVHDGIEAEYLGNEGIYELAVLDLGIPKRSGLDVLKNWRSKHNTIPVLILTARDAWYEKVDGFKAGADDYLAKPFHIEELLVRINALIHRSHQQPGGNSIQVGDLVLNEDRQEVIIDDGRVFPLSGSEFKLLRYFLLHPGQLLSKSTLKDHIYDFDSDKDSNVIEVYISHLRSKLGKHRIKTHRGQGYIFKEVVK
ncbi:MAG: response regulator transcription factor, partial [Methylococcales bacterium]